MIKQLGNVDVASLHWTQQSLPFTDNELNTITLYCDADDDK